MHHAFRMRGLQRLAHLHYDRRRFLRAEPPLLPQQTTQVLTLNVVHADELDAVGFTQIKDPDHVLVGHLAGQD